MVNHSSSKIPSTQLRVHNAGNQYRFDDWISWVNEVIQRPNEIQLEPRTAELERLIQEQGARIVQLEATITQLRSQVQTGQDAVDTLDERMGQVLAKYAAPPGTADGGQSEAGLDHHIFADEYEQLVNQKMSTIARKVWGSNAVKKARFVADLSRALFAHESVREDEAVHLVDQKDDKLKDLVWALCQEAAELREKTTNGRLQRWDFEAETGAPVDHIRQEAVAGSDEDGLIEFVVTPGYVVDNATVLKNQRVFARAQQENGDSGGNATLSE